ncbi:hypothetical protein BBJ28_00011304 [Nothophytophthora sp. Chile5]|nr:hypothetical protein BBJ28_00011304 [Nothophytophthora sp. Chile5]
MVARARKSDDTSRRLFRAQLVMEETTGERKLRHSKRHGELALDTTTQSAFFVYPRHMRLFQRKFEQPLKCVVGKKLLRVYSSNGKRSFMYVGPP